MIFAQDIEENAITYYRVLSRCLDGQFNETTRFAWFTTGRRSLLRFNGVLRSAVTRPDDLAQAAGPIVDVFLAGNLPFFWVDWPMAPAPGLADYLSARGVDFHRFTMPAMARGLDDLPPTLLPDGCEIVRVQTLADQADWLAVLMEGFELTEAARADFGQYLANSVAESQTAIEHVVARWQGEPCAIATLLHTHCGAGIYHVTTTPAHRGRGLGKALTIAAMQEASRAGHTEAILFATPSGFPLYQRLGFETVATADLYTWTGR